MTPEHASTARPALRFVPEPRSLFTACFLAACFMALLVPSAHAVEVGGIFEAAVPVSNQGDRERSRATQEGLKQVLVKASGQRSVLTTPALLPEFARADSLLGSYRYETLHGSGGASVARVRLSFDSNGVLGILNRSGAPVWSANRPLVYVHVVCVMPARSVCLPGSPQGDALLDAAALRGLPLSLPGAPEAVVPVVAPATVSPAVRSAATQAGAAVVVDAQLAAGGGRVRATGGLLVEGTVTGIDASGIDEADALRELVAQIADQLGARYAMLARQDRISEVSFVVDGIGGVADYASLERWLKSQPIIKDVDLTSLTREHVVFRLILAGDLDRLRAAMKADKRFASVGAPTTEGMVVTLPATLGNAP